MTLSAQGIAVQVGVPGHGIANDAAEVGRARYWVIARYALATTFRSRLFLAFFLACLVPVLALVVGVHLRYNMTALEQIGSAIDALVDLDRWLFDAAMDVSLTVSFLVVLVVGPALVAPDLANNAMPLYLSRPVTKSDYVLGKLLTLLALTAMVGWCPGLALVVVNAYYAGDHWLSDARMAGALVATSLVWAVCLSMIALAISAWVKWRPAATLGFLGLYVVTASVGAVLQAVFGVWSASLLSLGDAIDSVAVGLSGSGDSPMPVTAAWAVLVGSTAVATLALLRRIRAREVSV